MSIEIVKSYLDTLITSIKKKDYSAIYDLLADPFEVHASIMGKTYDISEKEKLEKFLNNMPAGISITIQSVQEQDGNYEAKVSMGMGFMKIPGKWTAYLDADTKLKRLDIK